MRTDVGQLLVTLVWSDRPALPSAEVSLVSDLDLVVKHLGTTWLGNHFMGRVSADRRSNVEKVRIPSASYGLYTIEVSAHHCPEGEQSFSLVVTASGFGEAPPDLGRSKSDAVLVAIVMGLVAVTMIGAVAAYFIRRRRRPASQRRGEDLLLGRDATSSYGTSS